ncbi:DNA polymerase III subunit epsilon [Corynebacterium renale]|uniref:DNA polymerase III epsilon subunit n=1 Tax=Corynebacterium renale TaxID=1724 RepID=A0A2A9DLC4_9CORY|nr:DNA polymerase III subunit epsilon [Corynebacterium renale]PFG27488.1 DNA polymerase III epsilon subunit [Corynebacterium renale]SQI23272.1 DNA polymerase III subunit epsilon [Corynebacterium renale]
MSEQEHKPRRRRRRRRGSGRGRARSHQPVQVTPDEEVPFVVVTVVPTGIHPSTSRLVAVDAVTFDADGQPRDEFFAVLNPGGKTNPGPTHYHGLQPEEIAEGRKFSQVLRTLDSLIDGRTAIFHYAPRGWGFVVSEARRAMNAAARANRSRKRSGGNHKTQKVGHVPQPVAVVDTLASARRSGVVLTDTRPGAVAHAVGVPAASPVASVERAARPAAETAREATLLVFELYKYFRGHGTVVKRDPQTLKGDRFGLQRSEIRVDAHGAPRQGENPGPYVPGTELKPGMEFVVAPEVEIDPNELIAAGTKAGLNYVEKLSRETSVVVTNSTAAGELRGKAMHAHRKEIPLMGDTAFMAAIRRMEPTE